MANPSLAPAGHSLIQAQMPIRAGEPRADAVARLERLVDLGMPGWRDRVTWRRDAIARGRTGALDLPGQMWSHRPAIERGGQVWLAGDSVAAPGLLGEVSINSALSCAQLALRWCRLETMPRRPEVTTNARTDQIHVSTAVPTSHETRQQP